MPLLPTIVVALLSMPAVQQALRGDSPSAKEAQLAALQHAAALAHREQAVSELEAERERNSDVAEAAIGAWCVEYLRVRKLGMGFHVIEIIALSVFMLGAKAIVSEAVRRRTGNGKGRSTTLQNWTPQMAAMGRARHTRQAAQGFRHGEFGRGRIVDRDPDEVV